MTRVDQVGGRNSRLRRLSGRGESPGANSERCLPDREQMPPPLLGASGIVPVGVVGVMRLGKRIAEAEAASGSAAIGMRLERGIVRCCRARDRT